MSKVRLAIIGNGMVGHRFIEDLLDKSDAANFDITVFCEEPRIAYDRVHLSSYFSHHTAEELSLVREGFYEKHGIKVLVGERAITINRQEKVIHSSAGRTVFYDKLIMATGSYPWIPPIKGSDTQDCFVYRTIEDLNAIESCARRSKRGAVVGGGLLGLEAAGALKNLGIETHVIEFAPMLMAEQLDQMGGEQLRRKIESMGVRVHTSKNTLEIVQEGVEARKTMRFADGSELEVDFIVFSTGIRPRDKLATQCGLDVAPRGGIVINDSCQTSDPDIYAIGECASWNNRVFGLVAPGYKMAQVAVDHILGSENAFEGADLSAKLKLLGVDVGGIGDAHGRTPGARSYVYLDESKEIYKRLIVSEDNKILSVGYNGMPRGCSDDEYPWDRNSENELDAKYLYVCHAELNALLNYTGTNMTHAKIYTTLFPCNECTKALIQAGISEVIYLCDKYAETPSVIAAKRMMKSAGVRYTPYHPANKKIQLDL